jgi:hypothetical protein
VVVEELTSIIRIEAEDGKREIFFDVFDLFQDLFWGVCDRTFRWYIDRYGEGGTEGLSDKRLTQASFRCAPMGEVMAVAEHYAGRYRGWNGLRKWVWVTFLRGHPSMDVHALFGQTISERTNKNLKIVLSVALAG